MSRPAAERKWDWRQAEMGEKTVERARNRGDSGWCFTRYSSGKWEFVWQNRVFARRGRICGCEGARRSSGRTHGAQILAGQDWHIERRSASGLVAIAGPGVKITEFRAMPFGEVL